LAQALERLVSVVIPTRDREVLLRGALEGVLADAEVVGVSLELIVADASPSGTARWVQEDFPSVIYLHVPAESRGRNRPQAALAGARVAHGEVVCFLDDDAKPRPGWIEALLAAYGDGVGGVGGRVAAGPSASPIVAKVLGHGRVIWSGFNSQETGVDVDFLPGGNMSFRREALAEIDAEALTAYTGRNWRWETDLCVQVRRNGWRLLYVGNATVDHSPPTPPKLNYPPERFGLAKSEALFAMRLFPGYRTALSNLLVEPARDIVVAGRAAAVALVAGFASVLGRWAGVVRSFRRS
jgi:cellulose synthase/poly-beta-1,6-N-acetylglucosamine synthase-like glycosyltransferase